MTERAELVIFVWPRGVDFGLNGRVTEINKIEESLGITLKVVNKTGRDWVEEKEGEK